MQVSHQDSHITHAVLGNQESVSMGVSDDAALMHIFSATLYTYPRLATVREIMCNAWDAHINAGITDRPIEVTVADNKVTVRDFGYGIHHDKIGQIYGTYGASTKRDDSTVTGGFGLGSKAPFAYTDNFEVISHHVGTKTIYRVSKSSMEKGGKPSINKIVSMPTTETGIQVSFSLLKETDGPEFEALINEVLQLGEIPVKLNGVIVEHKLPMSQSKTGYLVNDFRSTIRGKINLRYGNVVYPIPEHDLYAHLYQPIKLDMERLWACSNVIFMAEPDSITISPSRESLILTDATVEAITQLLKKYVPGKKGAANTAVMQSACESINKQIAALSDERLKYNLLTNTDLSTRHRTQSLKPGLRTFDTSQRAMTAYALEAGYDLRSATQRLKYVKELKKRGVFPKKVGEELVRIHGANYNHFNFNKAMITLVNKYVIAPIKMEFAKHPELAKVSTRAYANNGWYRGEVYSNLREAFRSSGIAYNIFYEKKAIICNSIKDVTEYLKNSRNREREIKFIVAIPKSKDSEMKALTAQIALEKLGYTVETYFPVKEKKTRKVEQEDGTVVEVVEEPVAKPKKKRNAYLTVNQSWSDSYRNFSLTRARKEFTPEGMTENPVAWVILRNLNQNGCDQLSWLGVEGSRFIRKKWGNEIAVVTEVQATKLSEQGVPRVDKFVYDHIDNALVNSPDFKRYLAGIYHLEQDYYGANRLVKAMMYHPDLLKEFGLRLHVNTEMASTIQMAQKISPDFSRYPQCSKLMAKIKKNPGVAKLIAKMESSEVYQLLSDHTVISRLTSYPSNHEKVQVTYELLRMALK